MTDIVERLRGLDMKRQILSDAADEIERLRAALEKISAGDKRDVLTAYNSLKAIARDALKGDK